MRVVGGCRPQSRPIPERRTCHVTRPSPRHPGKELLMSTRRFPEHTPMYVMGLIAVAAVCLIAWSSGFGQGGAAEVTGTRHPPEIQVVKLTNLADQARFVARARHSLLHPDRPLPKRY